MFSLAITFKFSVLLCVGDRCRPSQGEKVLPQPSDPCQRMDVEESFGGVSAGRRGRGLGAAGVGGGGGGGRGGGGGGGGGRTNGSCKLDF